MKNLDDKAYEHAWAQAIREDAARRAAQLPAKRRQRTLVVAREAIRHLETGGDRPITITDDAGSCIPTCCPSCYGGC